MTGKCSHCGDQVKQGEHRVVHGRLIYHESCWHELIATKSHS